MKDRDSRHFRVKATIRGMHVIFKVEATTGSKAVAEARRQARDRGMEFIMVNSVTPVEKTVISYSSEYGAPLTTLGGSDISPDIGAIFAGEIPKRGPDFLSLDEINNRIETVWERMVVFTPRPDDPPLKAYGLDGRVFLDDGINGRQELSSHTLIELMMMLYDWATYVGYYSDDFDVFVDECWE